MPGLAAATIIGMHSVSCLVFAVVFPIAAAQDAGLSTLSHAMFSVVTGLFGVGLGLVARGLWQGSSWPRTAAVVWLVILVPVGWAMAQAGGGLLGASILSSAVVGITMVAMESRNAG